MVAYLNNATVSGGGIGDARACVMHMCVKGDNGTDAQMGR